MTHAPDATTPGVRTCRRCQRSIAVLPGGELAPHATEMGGNVLCHPTLGHRALAAIEQLHTLAQTAAHARGNGDALRYHDVAILRTATRLLVNLRGLTPAPAPVPRLRLSRAELEAVWAELVTEIEVCAAEYDDVDHADGMRAIVAAIEAWRRPAWASVQAALDAAEKGRP